MTPALILIPALIALAMLHSSPATRVAQKVYVPCLLVIPMYMEFRLGGLYVNVTSFVSMLLALCGLWAWYRTLRFSFLDLCALGYSISAFYSDAHVHAMNVAVYAFLWSVSKCIFPYLIGRTLIEQTGMRTQFVKALVLSLAVIAIASLWEFRMETNLFQVTVERITHQTSLWGRQVRWGFGRVAGPYGHAITAGMIFSTGVLLQLWLVGSKSWNSSKALSFFRSRRKPLYLTLIVCLGLFMTQSRGPWIGCGFGLIVASIGFARNRRRAAVLSLSGLVVALAITSVVLDKYTGADVSKTKDRDQLNAEYRRELWTTYKPLIEMGGLWGWGTPATLYHGVYAWAPDQPSIDNEYIRIAMLQGYAGFVLFVLLLATSILHLIKLCITLRNREDILFAYCMLGVMIAMSFTLTTFYLADPMMQIVFLFLGWSESVRPTRMLEESTVPASAKPFVFERVFV